MQWGASQSGIRMSDAEACTIYRAAGWPVPAATAAPCCWSWAPGLRRQRAGRRARAPGWPPTGPPGCCPAPRIKTDRWVARLLPLKGVPPRRPMHGAPARAANSSGAPGGDPPCCPRRSTDRRGGGSPGRPQDPAHPPPVARRHGARPDAGPRRGRGRRRLQRRCPVRPRQRRAGGAAARQRPAVGRGLGSGSWGRRAVGADMTGRCGGPLTPSGRSAPRPRRSTTTTSARPSARTRSGSASRPEDQRRRAAPAGAARHRCPCRRPDADPWLLNCPNGTVDLRTGDIRPGGAGRPLHQGRRVAFDPAPRRRPGWPSSARGPA